MSQGKRIHDLRKAKRITQLEMAKMLSTTKQTISKYENEIVTNIPMDRLEALAKILDTTPEYLRGWSSSEESINTSSIDVLTENQQKLVEFSRTVPDNKARLVLKVMQAIVEFGC